MLLAIDVGNTNTVLGVFNGDILEHSWRVKTDPRDTADELWLQYSSLVEGFDITGIAICSTVPAVLREVRKLVNDHYSDLKSDEVWKLYRVIGFMVQSRISRK